MMLSIDVAATRLDREAIRRSIARELRANIVLADGPRPSADHRGVALSVRVDGARTATVSYRDSQQRALTRSVPLPVEESRAVEVIALLAGNLARNEALDLLTEAPTGDETTPAPPPGAGLAEQEPIPPMVPNSAPPAPFEASPPRVLNLSLFWPLALEPHSAERTINIELGAAYSKVGAIEGVGLNIFVLHINHELRGVAVATGWVREEGSGSGLALSALVHEGFGGFQGAEIAGVANRREGSTVGLRLAGVASLGGDLDGATAAGAFNLAGDVRGLQASVVNMARDVEGVQFSAAVGIARDVDGLQGAVASVARDVSGAQVAATVNVARNVEGTQIGLVNVAGNVSGLQLGLVNVADRVDGVSLGLASFAQNGRVQGVAWSSTLRPVNLAARFQVGHFYSQLGAGIDYRPSEGKWTYAPEVGAGARITLGRAFTDLGFHYSEEHAADASDAKALRHDIHYRVAVGFDFGLASVFAGGGPVHEIIRGSGSARGEAFAGLMVF
jgi:hypothetical protein